MRIAVRGINGVDSLSFQRPERFRIIVDLPIARFQLLTWLSQSNEGEREREREREKPEAEMYSRGRR